MKKATSLSKEFIVLNFSPYDLYTEGIFYSIDFKS